MNTPSSQPDTVLEQKTDPAPDTPSDVFAYLARFLPKSMDVLWVVQELEGVRNLTSLEEREQAYRDLYRKIEQRIVAAGREKFTAAQLRATVQTQFVREVNEGFLKPLFTATPVAPEKVSADETVLEKPAVLTFAELKKMCLDGSHESVEAELTTKDGTVIPIALHGLSWRRDLGEGRRGFVIGLRDLSAVQQYMQQRLHALTAALRQIKRGNVTALLSFETTGHDLREYVEVVKELVYDREAKMQEIDRLRHVEQEKEEQLQAKEADVTAVAQKLTEVRDHLQQRVSELEAGKHVAVERELKLQARIAELEQAKQAVVAQELRQQQRVAELEMAKQAAVERELQLQQRVAELESAKQAAVERELQVERLKRKFEQFSKGLSSEW